MVTAKRVQGFGRARGAHQSIEDRVAQGLRTWKVHRAQSHPEQPAGKVGRRRTPRRQHTWNVLPSTAAAAAAAAPAGGTTSKGAVWPCEQYCISDVVFEMRHTWSNDRCRRMTVPSAAGCETSKKFRPPSARTEERGPTGE